MKLASLAVTLFFAVVAASTAHSAEPTIDEKIEFMMTRLGIGDSASTFARVEAGLKRAMGNYPPETASRITAIMKRIYDEKYQDRRTIYISVYRSVYTDEEIDYVYEFYHSPIGSNILSKNKKFKEQLASAFGGIQPSFYEEDFITLMSDLELQRLMKLRKEAN